MAHIAGALRRQNRWAPAACAPWTGAASAAGATPMATRRCRHPATVAAYLVDAADTLVDVGSGLTHRARENPAPRAGCSPMASNDVSLGNSTN